MGLTNIKEANEFDKNCFSVRQNIVKLYRSDDLKKEAIRWVMSFKCDEESHNENCEYNKANRSEYCANKFIEFFNITKEDLKDK